jgi:hypothetical protein
MNAMQIGFSWGTKKESGMQQIGAACRRLCIRCYLLRKVINQVKAARFVPLLLMSPVLALQVDPVM